jgi:hypothetical protein
MKTAMQELLSEMSHPNWDRLSFDARYEMFDTLLNLERLQIIKAHIEGFDHIVVDYKKKEFAEQYYNQTYNQKQHIIDIMKADEDDGLYNQNK